jgi:hypothetical protein
VPAAHAPNVSLLKNLLRETFVSSGPGILKIVSSKGSFFRGAFYNTTLRPSAMKVWSKEGAAMRAGRRKVDAV